MIRVPFSPSSLRFAGLACTPTSRGAGARPRKGPRAVLAKRMVPLTCLLAIALALPACSSVRRTFGIDRSVPDEFAVVSRAPLAMPPDFALHPPRPGAPRPQEGTSSQRAEAVVFGSNTQRGSATAGQGGVAGQGGRTAPVTAGEGALLTRAGADRAQPDIRQVVERETANLELADRSFVDRLMFWQTQPPPGTVVDPRAESARLANNAALGRPLNEGDVPVIERRRRAPLEGMFDWLRF